MVIVRLMGGLGNQMFQYAAGRALAQRRGVELLVNLEHYEVELEPGYTTRDYELDRFECDPATEDSVDHAEYPTYKEGAFHFDAGLFDAPGDTYLVGYFQSERYFLPIADTIRSDFRLKAADPTQPGLLEVIASTQSVSVHVRRGDYVGANRDAFDICDLGYFGRAARTMAEYVPSPHFVVFSDDREWAGDNVRLRYPTTFVEACDSGAAGDMVLMSLCRHNIISNSTFGWWGAWLNANPDKRVIGPSRWFRDPRINATDVMPEEWLTVPTDETVRGGWRTRERTRRGP